MAKDIEKKVSILVVDDRPENLTALEATLDQPDLKIVKALSGTEALAKLLEEDFALILLDVQMPDMDGFETAKLMRGIDKTKHIPIIFVTAINKDQKYVFRGYESGAVDYIFKPLDPDILKSKVNVFVELYRQKNRLEEINLELSTLYKLMSVVSTTIDFNLLANHIVEVIVKNKLLDVLNKALFFIVQDNKLVIKSQYGFSDDFICIRENVEMGKCLCGLAAKTGDVIISPDSEKDANHNIKLNGDPHGHIIIPIKDSEGICGVVCLYTPKDIKVSERKIQLLKTVGMQLGIAIEKSKLYEKTKDLSLHDALTGLANRRLMDIILERTFISAKKYNGMCSVIMLDIDYFKKYNDKFGHQAGDELLVKIANKILDIIKTTDLVVRYGGEEFLILLPETDLTRAAEIAEKIRTIIEKETEVTVSLGCSSFKNEYNKKEEIIEKADNALYTAKKEGRNKVKIEN
ncbi:MAG: diguanylate cyclase [bacterium]